MKNFRLVLVCVAASLISFSCKPTPNAEKPDEEIVKPEPKPEPRPEVPAGEYVSFRDDIAPFHKSLPVDVSADYSVSSERLPLSFFGWGESTDYKFSLIFPEAEVESTQKVLLKYTMCAAEGKTPGEWDNVTALWVLNKQDQQWYEITRAISPYGNSFTASWNKSFYIDVTNFAHMLDGQTEFRLYYGGFDTNDRRGHAVELKFMFYKGEPTTYVAKSHKIYDSSRDDNSAYRGWVYGVSHPHPETGESLDIESNLYMGDKELPMYLEEEYEHILLRVAITGHGHDRGKFMDRGGKIANNAAEFDENTYKFFVNGEQQKAYGTIFYSNADNYPQAGTYRYDRANWAPGNPINVQYWQLEIPNAESMVFNMDLEKFESYMNDWRAEGIAQYIVQVDAFYVKKVEE